MSATLPPSDERDPVESPARAHVVIKPGATPIGQYARDVVRHRYLIRILARRDLKLRYRQTILGPTWVVLQPLIAAGILSFVFGGIAKLPTDGVPSFLFTYAGMLAWGVFSGNLSRTSMVLLSNSSLVAKVFFPRLVLPLSTIFGTLVDFAVTLVLVVVLGLTVGYPPTINLVALPVFIAFFLMLSVGFGSVLGAIAVRFRDVNNIQPVITQLLLYASPVAYSVSAVPEKYLRLYYLNPLVSLIEAVRWAVLDTPFPTAAHLAYSVGFAAIVFVGGLVLTERMEPFFADVI